jgi:hypothetical protein
LNERRKTVKEPVNPDNTWNNIDVQNDPQGYREAQARYLEEAETYRAQREREEDLEVFVREFVAAGGDEAEGKKTWQIVRNDNATVKARELSQAALASERQHISRSL